MKTEILGTDQLDDTTLVYFYRYTVYVRDKWDKYVVAVSDKSPDPGQVGMLKFTHEYMTEYFNDPDATGPIDAAILAYIEICKDNKL